MKRPPPPINQASAMKKSSRSADPSASLPKKPLAKPKGSSEGPGSFGGSWIQGGPESDLLRQGLQCFPGGLKGGIKPLSPLQKGVKAPGRGHVTFHFNNGLPRAAVEQILHV